MTDQLQCSHLCSALQAATGEDVSAEELGGAELHCTTSGEFVFASSFPVNFANRQTRRSGADQDEA